MIIHKKESMSIDRASKKTFFSILYLIPFKELYILKYFENVKMLVINIDLRILTIPTPYWE